MQRIFFDTPLEDIFRLPPKRKAGLRHLQLFTVRDLLYHFPHRYERLAALQIIADVQENDVVTIEGKILSIEAKKTWKTKKPIAEAIVEEAGVGNKNFSRLNPTISVIASPPDVHRGARKTGLGSDAEEKFLHSRSPRSHTIRAIWFHQPYIAKQLPPETLVRLTGKVTRYKSKLTMVNPIHERVSFITPPNPPLSRGGKLVPPPLQGGAGGGNRIPIYSETYGISSRWAHAAIENVFSRLSADVFVDPLPEDIRVRYHLPSLRRALEAIHFSQNEKEAEGARKRFAFEEIFFIQLTRVAMRNERNQQRATAIKIDADLTQAFRESLSFVLTRAQERVIEEICGGLTNPFASARLLQGDVGSGKTLVAAAAALQVAKNGCQTAYMAPTEILARQHFAEFCKRIGLFGVRVGLLTSSEALCFPSKAFANKPAHLSKQQLFKKAREGLVDVVIGTHALIARRKPARRQSGSYEIESHKNLTRFDLGISFKNLAFVVVDEQHRFGVHQRASLVKEGIHYLSMTATPIPRTLALTIYGDLDLSLLDEMPPGRTEVKTEVLAPSQRDRAYELIAREIAAGRQAFVICPRIKKDDESGMKAVEEEQKRLANTVFPHHTIGMVHGKLTPKEKEKTMKAFRAGEFPILVATTVVEVGIDIPNATIMLIEGAERFGLAQLHQLRGRVARSAHTATCLAIPGASSRFAKARLAVFAALTDGFALAEQDLQLRGPGELSGINQWGISDVGMEALRNIKMVEAARNEAQRILAQNPRFDRYPQLKKATLFNRASVHWE